MQFKRHFKLDYSPAQILTVPLINVIFLLLIFFILSPSLTIQPSINVKLPKAITSDIVQEKDFIITITGEDVVYLNGKVTTLKELSKRLSNNDIKNKPLLIKTDRRSSVGRIVDIWDLCRSLGIEKINIATNQEN